MDTNTSTETETVVTADTEQEQAPLGKLSEVEALLLSAIRSGDYDRVAGAIVGAFLDKGTSPAELLQAAISGGDADFVRAVTLALARHLTPPTPAPRPDPTTAPYENCIAAYIVGRLALAGYLPPDFIEGMGGVTDMTRNVAGWLLDGLDAYGWRGSVRELIHYADAGTPAGWKSADMDGAA